MDSKELVDVRKPNGRIIKVFRRDLSVYTSKGCEVVRCGTPDTPRKDFDDAAPLKKAPTKKADG